MLLGSLARRNNSVADLVQIKYQQRTQAQRDCAADITQLTLLPWSKDHSFHLPIFDFADSNNPEYLFTNEAFEGSFP